MDKVKIKKMQDILIVEKHNDETILKGSKIFCGCCGEQFGILTKKMKFPFKYKEFKDNLKDKSFEASMIGTKHKTCGHTMAFSIKDHVPFIGIEAYVKP